MVQEKIKHPEQEDQYFSLDKIVYKNDVWQGVFTFKDYLENIHSKYNIILTLDEGKYEKRIQDQKDSLKGTLLSKERVSKEQVQRNIELIMEELESMREKCRDVKFVGRTTGFKYSSEYRTTITFIIPDEVIADINEQKINFYAFIAKLIPSNV